jgi:hypothetical protein
MKLRILVVSLIALGIAVTGSVAMSSAAPSHARIAKKCKKKHGKKKCKKSVPTPVVTPPAPPTPLALTDAEVITRVTQKAFDYCSVDPDCIDYGYYYDTTSTVAACSSKTTYTWACYGWNDEDDGVDPVFTCDFREIVERVGYNGITSHQDLSYGSSGWACS